MDERLCLEKKFRVLLIEMSKTKAEMYSKVKHRERVKAQKNIRWISNSRFEVRRKFLVPER